MAVNDVSLSINEGAVSTAGRRLDAWIDSSLKEGTRGGHKIFVTGGQALRQLLDAGASRSDLQDLARLIAFNATFEVLDRIDDGYDAGLKDDYPGWRLIEPMDEKETARAVGGLHESLLEECSARNAPGVFPQLASRFARKRC